MVYHPDRPDLQRAWKITLQNLGKIFDYAKARNIPVILVVFPFTFQFDDVNTLSAPQKIVSKHASDNKVPVIGLLPILSEKMQEEGAKPNTVHLSIDFLP